MVGRDLINENSGWAVGNGESLNVWESPWLSLTAQERPMGPAPEALINLSVADLFLPEKREWNLDLIQQVLPFEEHKIKMLKPSLMAWVLRTSLCGFCLSPENTPPKLDMLLQSWSSTGERVSGTFTLPQKSNSSFGKCFTEPCRLASN